MITRTEHTRQPQLQVAEDKRKMRYSMWTVYPDFRGHILRCDVNAQRPLRAMDLVVCVTGRNTGAVYRGRISLGIGM